MPNDMKVEAEEEIYNNLRDEPCILCREPYSYVLGSYGWSIDGCQLMAARYKGTKR